MFGTPTTSFRTPTPPKPVERFDIVHPLLPPALDGTTILHVSDLHVRRNLLNTDRYHTILHALESTPADIIALTGDYMDEPGCEPSHERAALETLKALAAAWRPRIGAFAIFGNHDTPDFRRTCIRDLPSINFIGGRAIDLPYGLRLLGLDWPEDCLSFSPASAGEMSEPSEDRGGTHPTTSGPNPAPNPIPNPPLPSSPAFTISLTHHPTTLIPAAQLNIPILLAGHTHAGQIRLHPRLSPHTSSDLPPHLASGILQLRSTLCCITRGLGDGVIEGLRINCPRQMPLYTLRRGPLIHDNPESVRQVLAW